MRAHRKRVCPKGVEVECDTVVYQHTSSPAIAAKKRGLLHSTVRYHSSPNGKSSASLIVMDILIAEANRLCYVDGRYLPNPPHSRGGTTR